MTANPARDGNGASITLATTHWPPAATTVITSIEPDSIARESFDWTNYHTDTWQAPIPADTADPGGFTVEFFDNGDNGTAADDPSLQPPITAIPEDIAITYPSEPIWGSPPIASGTGYMVDYTPPRAKSGELMAGRAKFKWTGPITFTPHTEV